MDSVSVGVVMWTLSMLTVAQLSNPMCNFLLFTELMPWIEVLVMDWSFNDCMHVQSIQDQIERARFNLYIYVYNHVEPIEINWHTFIGLFDWSGDFQKEAPLPSKVSLTNMDKLSTLMNLIQ